MIAVKREPPAGALRWVAIAASLSVFVSGCGKPLPAGKVRVKGVVMHLGKPLHVGAISFGAKSGSESGMSRIGPKGGFEMVLSPGDYDVAVVSKDGFDTLGEQGQVKKAPSFVPERYASTATSRLAVTITQDAKPLTIALESE